MQTEKKSEIRPRKKTKTRILKWFLVVVVVLAVLVLLLVPAFVSSEKCRQIILTKINSSVDGRTDFADLSMGWLKGVKVADFSFDDNAGQISVKVKQIAAKPHYASILLGSLSFGKTVIDQPKVQLNLEDRQADKTEPAVSPREKAPPIALPIKKIDLVVRDGYVRVTDSKAQTVEVSRINSKISLRPPGRRTSFDVDMVVADKGAVSKIHADGHIILRQAKTGWTLEGTTGDLTVELNDLDLESLGPFFALAGTDVRAKGRVSADLKSEIKDGRLENLNADIKAKNLDITGPQLKGDRLQTADLDVHIKLNRDRDTLNIDELRLKTDWADINAAGTVPTTLDSLADFADVDSKYDLKGTFDCDVAAVMSQIPRTLGLKEGTKITSGRLTGDVRTSTKAGKRQIQANATLAELKGTVEGKQIALSQPVKLLTHISSDKAGINFDKLNISASFANINCTGTTELLKYDADVDLAKLQSELGQFVDIGKYQMAGRLVKTGEVSIKEDKITAAGTAQIENLNITSPDRLTASEPGATLDFAIEIDKKENLLVINSAKADASFGRVGIKDAVLPLSEKAAKPMHLVVTADGVDLNKLRPFAVLFASFPKEMQLAGIAEADISVTSKNDIYTIATESTKIKNLKLTYPGQKPFDAKELTLAFDVDVNPKEEAINVKKLRLDSPQIKIHKGRFTKTATKGRTKLQAQADCEYDWEAVTPFVGPYMPAGLIVKGKNKLPLDLTTEYPTGQTDKLLANLSTKGTLGFEEAHYMGLNFGPTEAQLKVQKGLVTIEPFSTTVNNGRLNFAGQADFKEKPTLLKTPKPMQIAKDIQINDETANKLLTYVNPIFANAIGVNGVANFGCERLAIPLAGADQNDLEIVGTIGIDNLTLRPTGLLGQIFSLMGARDPSAILRIHPTNFVLRNGYLQYDNMQIDIGDNPVNFGGVIGLDKSLDMTVTLPFTLAGKTIRIGTETIGKRISIRLTGTIDKPKLDTDKLIENQLKDVLIENIFDKLLK